VRSGKLVCTTIYRLCVSIVWIIVIYCQYSDAVADDISILNGPCPRGTWSGPSFILRSDFNNLNVLECGETPGYYKLEQGAQVSGSRAFNNDINGVSIDGLASVVMRYAGQGDSGLRGLMIGPYVQGDGTYQFNTETSPSKGIDTLTYGVFTQFAFLTTDVPYVKDGLLYNGFRFRVGDVNGSSGINSTSLVAEWLPAFRFGSGDSTKAIGLPAPAHVLPIIYELDVDLMAQYDELNYGKNSYQLFHYNDSALRIGPLLTLKTQLNAVCGDSKIMTVNWECAPEVKDTFWDKLVASVSLHTSDDVYSGKRYYLATANLTYNYNDHFGVFATYSYGNLEATANFSNQIRAGLSLKF
jgi:hypothetical protein